MSSLALVDAAAAPDTKADGALQLLHALLGLLQAEELVG